MSSVVNLRKLGEAAELVFMARAASLGFTVLRPNSPCRYDLVLDTGRRLLRIQVKSTATRRHGRYSVSLYACDSRRRYTRRDLDFLAAWIIPLNAWYIIPARALCGRARVYFYPYRRSGWSERYRERWDLLHSPCQSRRSSSVTRPCDRNHGLV